MGQNECLRNILKQCGGNNVVPNCNAKNFEGVTSLFRIKVQNDYTDNRT